MQPQSPKYNSSVDLPRTLLFTERFQNACPAFHLKVSSTSSRFEYNTAYFSSDSSIKTFNKTENFCDDFPIGANLHNADANEKSANESNFAAQACDPSARTSDPTAYSSEPSAHANDSSVQASDSSVYASDSFVHASDPSDYASDPTAHASDPSAHACDPSDCSCDPVFSNYLTYTGMPIKVN